MSETMHVMTEDERIEVSVILKLTAAHIRTINPRLTEMVEQAIKLMAHRGPSRTA